MASGTPFNVVYHVAALNHWRDVAKDQLPILLRNRNIQTVYITIAGTSDANGATAARELIKLFRKTNRSILFEVRRSKLDEFEHTAMNIVDQVATAADHPILYFHAKGVSYFVRGDTLFEKWRRYLNEFVGEADKWADFLSTNDYDTCGRLQTLDPKHGLTYFAGNFWMAKSSYLKSLPPYAEFIKNPPITGYEPGDRFLAELAVNRSGRMRPFATDGTNLTPPTLWPYLEHVQLRPAP